MKMNGMYHADWLELIAEHEHSADIYRERAKAAVDNEQISKLLKLAAEEQCKADGIRKLEGC